MSFSDSDSEIAQRMGDDDFEPLAEWIGRATGWDLSLYKGNYVRRRVGARVRALGLSGWLAYHQFLQKDPDELAKLKDRLTVNVTEFFRDGDVWHWLRDEFLPGLWEEKFGAWQKAGAPGVFRPAFFVWSAGCSSGEEPYSLAILFDQAFGARKKDYRLRLLATDLDPVILEKAREGSYSSASLLNMDVETRGRYFLEQGDRVSVRPEIKRDIAFRQHNLFADPPPTGLDLVLCRNVMIYFSRELQQRLMQNFHKALRENGTFLTGKTETLLGPARQIFRATSSKARAFQRV